MEFQDKVIIITGGASGIGRVTASAFIEEGGSVVIADTNKKEGESVVKSLIEKGGNARFFEVNVAEFSEVSELMKKANNAFGKIDVLVNNAGIGGVSKPTAEKDIDDWHKIMRVNTDGVFYGMKAVLPYMLKQGQGAIVNTASIAGLRGLPNNIAYVASKHAVVGMTKTAAMEYAKKNIRINAICPGFTITPLFDPKVIDGVVAGLSEKLKRPIPMKRFAAPIEVARVILWLCSPNASFITGVAMPIDGGLTA